MNPLRFISSQSGRPERWSRQKAGAGIALIAFIAAAAYFSDRAAFRWLLPEAVADGKPTDAAPSSSGINKPGQGKVWVCPMHHEIVQDHPGTCPICGMDLVEAGGHALHDHGVHVDASAMQKLGVRLARVTETSIGKEVRTYGNVTAAAEAVFAVHSKFDGWIRKTYVHSVGQRVRKGQVLYEIYSPDLIRQQKEYLRFVSRRNQILETIGDVHIRENEYVMDLLEELSRERIKFLHEDIAIETVQQLEDHRRAIEIVPIIADQSGVVTRVDAREGSYVTPAVALFTLADVSKVWVDAVLYPDQAGAVHAGDRARVKVGDARPVDAKVEFVSPVAESNKVSARVALDNSDGLLRPGMYADVLIRTDAHTAPVLPRSAVMYTGAGSMVMLSRGDGRFMPVPVETGAEEGDNVEIVDGLAAGAEVAANGQFLLDAAASMSAAAERMRSGRHD